MSEREKVVAGVSLRISSPVVGAVVSNLADVLQHAELERTELLEATALTFASAILATETNWENALQNLISMLESAQRVEVGDA